jgi:two-component system, LytTR family, sensor kinase
MEASRNYYIAQILGWSIYILISTVVFVMSGTEMSVQIIGGIYLVFALGLIVTHLYRMVIIKLGWLDLDILRLIPRVLGVCIALAVAFHSTYITIGNLVFDWKMTFDWLDQNLFTWVMLFFIWNLIYFAYIFFQRYQREEIKNLRLEAARNEYELRRLRDQMNPHFIFNAMNTIRALIDEDPSKAKNAVTQLSNVLRSSLQTSKQELIPLEKELQIVKDYLEIEKARYEERLNVEINIAPKSVKAMIPPLMLQTIVENAIKHGIGKLPSGGCVKILSEHLEDYTEIQVLNSGQYQPESNSDSNLGLENTKNRLKLSFGDSAWMSIGNLDEKTVRTIIHLPNSNKSGHDKNHDH